MSVTKPVGLENKFVRFVKCVEEQVRLIKP
jgi:hypothetical protein